jgi:hypothetical protein
MTVPSMIGNGPVWLARPTLRLASRGCTWAVGAQGEGAEAGVSALVLGVGVGMGGRVGELHLRTRDARHVRVPDTGWVGPWKTRSQRSRGDQVTGRSTSRWVRRITS